MYLTYEEYRLMGGTLDETQYDDLEFEAEAIVNWYTFNRLSKDTQIPLAVKRLIKYLINLVQAQNEGLLGSVGRSNEAVSPMLIASQSNDGVSISYNTLSAIDLMKSLKESEETAIRRHLQGVVNQAGRNLLYRGLYPGE